MSARKTAIEEEVMRRFEDWWWANRDDPGITAEDLRNAMSDFCLFTLSELEAERRND